MAFRPELTDFAEKLDEVLSEAQSDCTERVGIYQFGKRNLEVRASPISRFRPRDGALVTASNSDWSTHQLLILDEEIGLTCPDSLELGPYGFARHMEDLGWLVTFNRTDSMLVAMDTTSRTTVCLGPRFMAPRHHAEFLRGVAHWHSHLSGGFLVHGGAVSRDGRGVLIFGRGGAGKTTLVKHCRESGWRLLGDNVVEIEPNTEGFGACLVYPTLKIREPFEQHISGPYQEWDSENQKTIHFLGQDNRGIDFGEVIPIKFGVLLTADVAAEPRKIPPGEGLFELGPDTLSQFPGFGKQVLEKTKLLSRLLPLHFLPRGALDELEHFLTEGLGTVR